MTLKYIHSVRSHKFRNQAPNKSSNRINVEIQAKVDYKEKTVHETIHKLKVRIICINEKICRADAPYEKETNEVDGEDEPGSAFKRLYHFDTGS